VPGPVTGFEGRELHGRQAGQRQRHGRSPKPGLVRVGRLRRLTRTRIAAVVAASPEA
jgi:hypothetical protein